MANMFDFLNPKAQREVAEASAQFQQVQFGGYKLIYGAFNGCGNTHNWNNLRRADSIPGVDLLYINVNPVGEPVSPRPPGQELTGLTSRAAANLYDLRFGDPTIKLVNSFGIVVGEFDSNSPTFVNDIRRATGQRDERPAQRGRFS